MATKQKQERLMTLAELASYLHMGRKTVHRLATAKKLPGMMIDKEWRFRRREIDTWLDQQSSGGDDDFGSVPDGMRLPLGDLLPAEAIVHDMRAKDALGAIEELAARAYTQKWLNDKPWFIGALVERESLSSTAMEGGVAFLHTRSRDTRKIARPFIVVGRSYAGIDFGAPDGNATFVFFLLGLKYDRLHLPILGRLARLTMRNPTAVAKLRATTSPTKIRNTLLTLDSGELLSSTTQEIEYRAAPPKLDREVRLRAIMRLNAKRKSDEKTQAIVDKKRDEISRRKAKVEAARAKKLAAAKKKADAVARKKAAAVAKKEAAAKKKAAAAARKIAAAEKKKASEAKKKAAAVKKKAAVKSKGAASTSKSKSATKKAAAKKKR